MSRQSKLTLAYDYSRFLAAGGEEVRGPAIGTGQEVNDEWTAWLADCLKKHDHKPICIEVPAERLYWVLLGTGAEAESEEEAGPALPRHGGRVGEESDRFAFETVLPVPVEETETRFAAAGSHVIGCALEREVLDDWITLTESAGADVVSVKPSGLLPTVTEPLNGAASDRLVERLEFRAGLFEHKRIHRRRSLNLGVLAAAWLLGCLIAAVGWWRLGQQYEQQTQEARDAAVELARNVLPDERQSSDRPSQVLANLVSRGSRLQGGEADKHRAKPVAEELITILQNWPELEGVELDVISITERSLSLNGSSAELTAADTLAGTLQSVLAADEWESFQPSSTQQRGERYKFNVTGRRTQAGGGRGR
jgi:hypothetical protein